VTEKEKKAFSLAQLSFSPNKAQEKEQVSSLNVFNSTPNNMSREQEFLTLYFASLPSYVFC
jgi:hypothetical protein